MKFPCGATLLPAPTQDDIQVRTTDDTVHYCKTPGVWTPLAGGASAAYRLYDAVVSAIGTPGVDCDFNDVQSAVSSGAKTIYIRKGTYLNVGAALTFNGLNNVRLIGEEWSSTIIQSDDSLNHVVEMFSCSDMSFENIKFEFALPLTGGKDAIVYTVGACHRINFRRCWFSGDSPRAAPGFVERGIYSMNGAKTYWNIDWCRFDRLAYSGMTLYDGSPARACNYIKIINNTFTDGSGNFGLDTYVGCKFWVISFNHFENLNSPVASISGALFFNGQAGSSLNLKHAVSFNVFKNVPLACQFDHNCHEIIINGNVFDGTDVNIRFCRNDNTRHHVSNNYNHGATALNVDIDYTSLDVDAVFYLGGNWQNELWRIVGDPNQPAYLNSWTFVTASANGAAFVVDDSHEVLLRGNVTGGSIGTVIFTLPPNHRPPDYPRRFVVESNGGYGLVEVNTAGQVTALAGDPTRICLDGIRFRVN